LQHVVETPFERASYTYAVRILEKSNKAFEFPVSWGADLQSEHERFLAEEYFQKPVILTDYPKNIKAFYMRANEDDKTVAAMDILVPKIGEIVGGSQREERLDRLTEKIKENNLRAEDYWWYLELRKYGTVPHAGFGAGFERLIQFVTGMDNIRDVIPFPRHPGKADF
jgi:asparaginyl-tRNA synthetase